MPGYSPVRFNVTIVGLCTVAILSISTIVYFHLISPVRHANKTNLLWYQTEVIYEINLAKFHDSNQDEIGDLQGLMEKMDYLERNHIRSILLQSSIFNVSDELVELLDRQFGQSQTMDLFRLDPQIGDEDDWLDLMKILKEKNMHLIVDLPLSSTGDHRNFSWYGGVSSSSMKIEDPCRRYRNDLGCHYYQIYKRLPLDFSNDEIVEQAQIRLRYWLEKKNIDGIRVDLPLVFNHSSQTYSISLQTIDQWQTLVAEISRKSTIKLLLFDIPSNLQSIIHLSSFNDQILYSNAVAQFLNKQTLAKFWQIGSEKDSFRLGRLDDLSRRILFTIGMLIGGTPIVLYGDELGIKQKYHAWMPWTSNPLYERLSTCIPGECEEILSKDENDDDFIEISVQTEENDTESLLIFFRRLSQLRQHPSFQNGVLEKGFQRSLDIVWFIRKASDQRGFLIVIHYNRFQKHPIHLSLQNLTGQQIPQQISSVYQWPEFHWSFLKTDQFMIYPGSINIFWWPTEKN